MPSKVITLVTLMCLLSVARAAIVEAVGASHVAIVGDTTEPTVQCINT